MRARSITIVALLAAIYAVVGLLPGFPVIGVPGSDIRLTRSLEMGYGVALGPALGPLAAFVGAVVGRTLTGGGTAILFTPLALVSSFMAATIAKKSLFGLRGWLISSFVMGGILIVWYATPVGQSIPIYAIPHLLGLGLILALRERIADLLNSENKGRLFLGMLIVSYPSTMAGQMLGNLIFLALFSPTPGFFMAVLPVTLVERSVITILGAVVGVPIILAIRTYLSRAQ
ncbi:MAG: hypothetical protein N3D12_02110 [Candidatus Methanomethyliaceae archaeon]|nr:hypothetical protein [Candidatus Methanomethyliaceae archaeon]